MLAAINRIEPDYGRDESTSSAGAVGFMPSTWSEYAVRADTRHAVSPYDAKDTIFAAARLLAANGGERRLHRAIYAYNHAQWYVAEVLFVAERIVGDETPKSAHASARIDAMLTSASLLAGTPYVWGGGHAGWIATGGYDCSGFVSAVLHAAGYLDAPQTTQTLPSAQGIASGPGRWVTIFDRDDAGSTTEDHVIIEIDGQWWESGGDSASGGAADVHRIPRISSAYLATFNAVLHPRGL